MTGLRGKKVPKRAYSSTLVSSMETSSMAAESYRMLRTNLIVGSPDARTLLVTSAGRGEGKSITSANLAVVLAQADRTVVLVDADLRIPSAHTVFNLPPRPGRHIGLALSAPLDENVVLDCIVEVAPGLNVLPAAEYLPRFPSEVLGSRQFTELLNTLGSLFDYVIVDTAPVGLVTDAVVASQYVDGVLFVVDHRGAKRRFVERAMGELRKAGRNVLGVVLNRYPVESRDRYVLGGEYYSSPSPAAPRSRGGAPVLPAWEDAPLAEPIPRRAALRAEAAGRPLAPTSFAIDEHAYDEDSLEDPLDGSRLHPFPHDDA